jgi:dienelactone hydrolase
MLIPGIAGPISRNRLTAWAILHHITYENLGGPVKGGVTMRHPQLKLRTTVALLNEVGANMPRLLGYDEAGGKADFSTWQKKARRKLRDLLGFLPARVTEPRSWLLSEEEDEGFVREKWVLESPFGDHILFYRLVPEEMEKPDCVLLALHGHGPFGADSVAGVQAGRPGEEDTTRQFNYDFGAQFARRGYLVYAPCHRGFAQRSDLGNPWDEATPGNSCVDINARAILLGSTDVGLRIQDTMHLIDWLRRRPDEKSVPLGCVGLSGGGHTTELLAAVDTRIDVACIQGYFAYWTEQIMDVTHCNCNYIPGLLKYFEQDDVCALICPRPLLVTTATEDAVAPVKSFRKAYRSLKGIYRDQGVESNLQQEIFSGGHEFTPTKAFPFFNKYLKE